MYDRPSFAFPKQRDLLHLKDFDHFTIGVHLGLMHLVGQRQVDVYWDARISHKECS